MNRTEIETRSYGPNTARAFLGAAEDVSNRSEGKVHGYISELTQLNEQNRDLQTLITALTHAKKEKKADFSSDEKVKQAIDAIHRFAPDVLGHADETGKFQYIWNNEDDIETALQLLDGQVKTQVADVNRITMYINQNYEDRIQYIDIAQKTLEMIIRHIESIISKYSKG